MKGYNQWQIFTNIIMPLNDGIELLLTHSRCLRSKKRPIFQKHPEDMLASYGAGVVYPVFWCLVVPETDKTANLRYLC
jgi:hypothetical protein